MGSNGSMIIVQLSLPKKKKPYDNYGFGPKWSYGMGLNPGTL